LVGRVETFSITSNVPFSAVDTTTGQTIANFSGYSGSFDLFDAYDPVFGFYQYEIQNASLSVLGSEIEPGFSTVTVTGDPFLTLVPLPSSAPMFGLALIALGAAGVALRGGIGTRPSI
jgi:hypothetical protein